MHNHFKERKYPKSHKQFLISWIKNNLSANWNKWALDIFQISSRKKELLKFNQILREMLEIRLLVSQGMVIIIFWEKEKNSLSFTWQMLSYLEEFRLLGITITRLTLMKWIRSKDLPIINCGRGECIKSHNQNGSINNPCL